MRQCFPLILTAFDLRPQMILDDRDDEIGVVARCEWRQLSGGHRDGKAVTGHCLDGGMNDAVRQGGRAFDRPPCRIEVVSHERFTTVDDHLRRVHLPGLVPRRISLLASRQFCRRKSILPAQIVPVVDVLAETDKLHACGRLRFDHLLEQHVSSGTTRAAFRGEQLDENRDRRAGSGGGPVREREANEGDGQRRGSTHVLTS